MQGAARGANTRCKHRKAIAYYFIAYAKLARSRASRIKETPAPQTFLSSSINNHRSDSDFRKIVATAESDPAATLSRDFWQQKYFQESFVFARSPLATANFFGIFRIPIRNNDPPRETFSKPNDAVALS